MANHKSSIKRIRANEKKRLRNRYYHKTTRNAIKKRSRIYVAKSSVYDRPFGKKRRYPQKQSCKP